jgi:hypothetical protein
MPYASRTGTRKNLDALRAAKWGLLISATGVQRDEGFSRICLDNGAWTSYQQGTPWRADLFRKLIDKYGERADFIIAPDIVAGGLKSLQFSLSWIKRLQAINPRVLIPVQDGMDPHHLSEYLDSEIGIFVGGTTEFKYSKLGAWGELAKQKKAWMHVGRVNSIRAMKRCAGAHAHSFDGSGPSRFYKHLAVMQGGLTKINAQPDLFD